MTGKYKCPICGKYEFEEYDDLDICDICGWMNDALYEKDPDFHGGYSRICLNMAREVYRKAPRWIDWHDPYLKKQNIMVPLSRPRPKKVK